MLLELNERELELIKSRLTRAMYDAKGMANKQRRFLSPTYNWPGKDMGNRQRLVEKYDAKAREYADLLEKLDGAV